MASKNSVKSYSENSFYHLYNRGVEKRNIFLNDQDYSVFLSYMQTYLVTKDITGLNQILSSENSTSKEKDLASRLLRLKNYSTDIDLICYALLPNHFHLLTRNNTNSINHFMNSIGTRYGMYFNRKYKRVGVLFQDVYKAVLVENEDQLLHLSRYIHLNPVRYSKLLTQSWQSSPYPCSLPEFLNLRTTSWIKKNYVLDYFSRTTPNNYQNFLFSPQDENFIASQTIDST